MVFLGLLFPQKAYEQRLYEEPFVIYKPTCDPVKATGQNPEDCFYREPKAKGVAAYSFFNPCSCVSAVKNWTGYAKPVGLAKNWPVNSGVPVVGAVVVSRDGWAGHNSLVIALHELTFRVKEYNYIPCEYSEREIKYDDPILIGFWIGG